ncbi:hypothetical protein WDW86_08275 [Bdellovibrionota bacterium FG-2]
MANPNVRSTPPQFRKSIKLLYPKFQLTLIGQNFIVMVLICVGIYGGVNLAFSELINQGIAAKLPESDPYFEFIKRQSPLVLHYLLICLGVGLFTSVSWTLYISHKIAGPMAGLRGYFDSISIGGRIRLLGFRKTDFFQDIPVSVNHALQTLEKSRKER